MQQNETLPILSITSEDDFDISFLRSSHSYDGHCLRAYYYWKEWLPWVRQVEDTIECFNINGQLFTEDDLIEYRGETYNAKQFYTKFCSS